MKYVSILELAPILLPRDGKGLIAVVEAYLDASFTDGGGISSVAGYIASAGEWASVETEWAALLDYWRLEDFHLADLEQRLGRENGELCVLGFESIIRKSGLVAIGSALFDKDWEREDWGSMTTIRRSTKYLQCFDMVLNVIQEESDQRVAVTCDLDAPPESILTLFRERMETSPEFVTLDFGTQKTRIPLQVADLGVGKLRRSWLSIVAGEASELPWGDMPTGRHGLHRTAVWSQRQAGLIVRALHLLDPSLKKND